MDDLITPEMIKEILQPYVEKVKQQMETINQNAIDSFYGIGSGTYNRAGGFKGLGKNPEEIWKDTSVEVLYTYNAGEVSVNPWLPPWRDTPYPGDSGWAFDTGFVHGLHGGPRPTRGGWTWAPVARTEAPWNIIAEGVMGLDI